VQRLSKFGPSVCDKGIYALTGCRIHSEHSTHKRYRNYFKVGAEKHNEERLDLEVDKINYIKDRN
jgi:hypothetical protein